jgi:hypothetical protein
MLFGMNFRLFSQNQNITINRKVNSDKSIDLYYEKKLPGSYYIYLEFSNVSNCDISEYKTVINGFSGRLVKLVPINTKSGIGYSLKYYSIIGEPNPKVDKEFQYILPFNNGKKIKIYEADNVNEKYFESEKPENWKSYIVNSKTPDTLLSMRKGIVVRLTNDFETDTTMVKSFTSKRNSVLIEHSDGTFARYEGFKKNKIFVELGQTVYPQTQLGVLDVFNKNSYRASFSIYFLSDKNLSSMVYQTFKNYKSKYEFVTPHFLTQEGVITVESKKEYISLFNETALFQEFTRSEKKKYLKDPTQFK